LMLASASLGLLSRQAKVSDVIGGFAVLLSAMALGAAARYRARARSHEIEQVKMREREQLARDLHDTVAHHVSAIAIRAQAGLATAPTNPEAAIDALRVIATEASRTLAEMRAMVRLLRRDESADLAPSPRIADLERLIQRPAEGPEIHVHISGNLDDLSPSVSAAICRLAQESITNARRHARHATRIDVGVTVDDASVRLRVSDEGDPTHARQPASAGYGLLGMMERAELLGGTCQAGPNPERGWAVTAVLPRQGPTP
ncbi:MAG TPA: histidine kinase, partial [Sorangium sp.]|nr:histidine kinase [Sorangium sp.]